MTRKVTILLVEDDQSMLDGMHDLLHVIDLGYDFTVLTASNGKEALAKVAETPPDLIVSDIMMPVMDGLTFLARVRKNPDWFHIPFIFLTAKGDKDEIHAGHLSGADLYITKPFDSTRLLELIKTQIDHAFKLETTHQQNMENLKKGILQILNHELRTPLTYVTAYYEMLADSLHSQMPPAELQEYLRGIQAGCIRLTKLVEDFIQVIKLRTGETEQQIEAQSQRIESFGQLIEVAMEAATAVAQTNHIQVTYTPEPNIPPIHGDAQSLQIVLNHLLDNAIKFTRSHHREGGQVTIAISVENQNLHLAISDEGPGLPASIQPHIFDLFYQYNRTLQEQQGAGVGLTIAKGIINLHGGHIWVESEEGRGSTFHVSLPLAKNTDKPHTALLNKNGSPLPATVLVVEDDQHLLIGLKELLELLEDPFELTVLTATDGHAGLQQVNDHLVHLIISDIMMSPMNGIEFLEAVRQNPEWIDIPFIFLTARGEPQDIHEGWSRGVQMYITKPYDSDQLLSYVIMLLQRHFQRQKILAKGFEDLKRSILELMTPEFRSPLAAVSANSSRLANSLETDELSSARDDDELKQALEAVRAGGTRLTRLVEDFIALAELRTGEAEIAFNMRAQDIAEPRWLFMEAIQSHQSKSLGQGVRIRHNSLDTLPRFFGDSVYLSEVLRRLLTGFTRLCLNSGQQEVYLVAQHNENWLQVALRLARPIDAVLFQAIEQNLSAAAPDPLMSDQLVTPDWQIVAGYVGLHNGRIQTMNKPGTGFLLTFTLPLMPIRTAAANAH